MAFTLHCPSHPWGTLGVTTPFSNLALLGRIRDPVLQRSKTGQECAYTFCGFEWKAMASLEIWPHQRIRDRVPERAEEFSSCPPC
jgi:hypothetical protein